EQLNLAASTTIQLDPPETESTCTFKTKHHRTGCTQSANYSDDMCLLHSRADKNTRKFQFSIEQQVAGGQLDFCGYVFPVEADFSGITFSKNVSFKQAVFLSGVNFSKTTFLGTVSFEKSVFSNEANFDGSSFSSDAHFDAVAFLADAHFNKAS